MQRREPVGPLYGGAAPNQNGDGARPPPLSFDAAIAEPDARWRGRPQLGFDANPQSMNDTLHSSNVNQRTAAPGPGPAPAPAPAATSTRSPMAAPAVQRRTPKKKNGRHNDFDLQAFTASSSDSDECGVSVSPRAGGRPKGFGQMEDEVQEVLVPEGGVGGHPLDSVLDGGGSKERPKHARRKHRRPVSFSDQPGNLEGGGKDSLAGKLRALAKENQESSSLPLLTSITKTRSKSMTSADLIDLLEGGEARECLSDFVVSTPRGTETEENPGGWEHCTIEISPDKKKFRMFTDENHKFILSARRDGDDFFISQYVDFPDEFEKDAEIRDRFSAVVRKSGNCYRIWSRGCEICDNELAKYRCGLEDDASQRQELGLVRHTETQIMDGSRLIADARQITIDIPTLDSELLRQGWCARFPRTPETSMSLASMLPAWNPRIQSLSMKFLHSRVKAASSKNFLVSKMSAMDEEHACLQYGKTKSGMFNLSYRTPVAGIQAFGVSLSLYNWLGTSGRSRAKKKK